MNWKPTASLDALRARAALLATIREFFAQREVLEVSTPLLSRHATVDRHIESFATVDVLWLQTSPQFAMTRLLSAASGPLSQLAPVFRFVSLCRHPNPHFPILVWSRPGFSLYRYCFLFV